MEWSGEAEKNSEPKDELIKLSDYPLMLCFVLKNNWTRRKLGRGKGVLILFFLNEWGKEGGGKPKYNIHFCIKEDL